MKRVMIIGCCGSGKSTLAFQLAPILNLPLTHLDQLYWQPGWVESSLADFESKLNEVLKSDSWLIDGNYTRTIQERAHMADTIIFLDFSTFDCIIGVLKRIFTGYGKVRKDMSAGCPERLDLEFISYVLNFKRTNHPKILQCLQEMNAEKRIITLKNRQIVRDFVHSIQSVYATNSQQLPK
ncbi:MAG: hypothetical protein K2X81_00525 [Candidatus Obscuribacterales bacterium]|nr:hypothetical protein [Candidatus Obscuribacterales bacterium]